MRKFLMLIVVPWLFVFWQATHASADTGTSVSTGDGTIDSGVGRGDGAPGDGSNGSPPCTYLPMTVPPSNPMWYADRHNIPVDDGSGGWYAKTCGSNFYGIVYISRVDPAELLAAARRRLTLPLPTPHTNPSGQQLVNVPTWLWVDGQTWHDLTSIAAVPGVSVTVVAQPVGSLWSMGDGSQVTCTGAGTPFDPSRTDPTAISSCSYTYRLSSAGEPDQQFHGSVTVQWRATWTVSGAPGGGNLGSLFRTTSFSTTVSEVQALNRTAAGS
ncbi:MAG: hypothetical protein ACXVKQ_16955 [Acidimicrobiia bacterium]